MGIVFHGKWFEIIHIPAFLDFDRPDFHGWWGTDINIFPKMENDENKNPVAINSEESIFFVPLYILSSF